MDWCAAKKVLSPAPLAGRSALAAWAAQMHLLTYRALMMHIGRRAFKAASISRPLGLLFALDPQRRSHMGALLASLACQPQCLAARVASRPCG